VASNSSQLHVQHISHERLNLMQWVMAIAACVGASTGAGTLIYYVTSAYYYPPLEPRKPVSPSSSNPLPTQSSSPEMQNVAQVGKPRERTEAHRSHRSSLYHRSGARSYQIENNIRGPSIITTHQTGNNTINYSSGMNYSPPDNPD